MGLIRMPPLLNGLPVPVLLGPVLLVPVLVACRAGQPDPTPPAPGPAATAPGPAAAPAGGAAPERLAAPGILEPEGGSLVLAAPVGPLGITPRLERLDVRAGDRVRRGQLLARFDNHEGVRRELDTTNARIRGLHAEIAILGRQTQRFEALRAQGVVSLADFEDRSLRLTQLRNSLAVAEQERRVLEERLRQAELFAPISGEVLSVLAQPGEQPGPGGVLELAAIDTLVVKAQVEEASVGRLALGQPVEVLADNGAFPERLRGRVSFIAAKVSPRRSLSLRPGYYRDSEPRVVDVTIRLDRASLPSGGPARSGSKVQVFFLSPTAQRAPRPIR
jgi:HlyD family secretion protein